MSDYQLKTLQAGILLGESPRWHDGRIWFADWVAETLYAVTEDGHSTAVAKVASLPFSIDWLPDGRCLVVNARAKALQVLAEDGSLSLFAALDHACNEIVVDGRGNSYLNCVNFEFPGGQFRPGFILLVTPDGRVQRQPGELAFPNGMAITPDGRTLICAESFNGNLTAFDIADDGSLSNQRVWAKLDGQGADGICMDAEGAVWAGSGQRCVRVAEGGRVLEEVPLDLMAFACMLGGADGRTLFITANEWTGQINTDHPTGKLYSTSVAVPHAGFPKSR
ncbi:sugar lactone lactonase YvrE [Devosia sp. UYZn731]|uniref:SMP-30/gluconolactonase/LRE family protein n=1 Tax=Devosia sp. UYZn731 TaxID=3156345 RepID=UPI003398ED5F